MHVNKIHLHPHSVDGPKGRELLRSRPGDADPSATGGNDRDVMSAKNVVRPYTDQLQNVPDIREDFVEAARARLVRGEYFTREAVVDTAALILKQS